MRQMQEKRARAEARRVRHFEQLGEAKRVAVVAKAEAQVCEHNVYSGKTGSGEMVCQYSIV